MTFKWETPKIAKGRRPALTEAADKLRKNPGRWARIAEYDNSSGYNYGATVAYLIRKGERAGFAPAGSFDATSQTNGDTVVVYARYVGE